MQLLPLKKIVIEPIGFVKRASNTEDVKNRSLISQIIIKSELTEALDDIENFSHIFVIFWLSKISDAGKRVMKVHPRGRDDLPFVGVFATRTPNRPNPLALTLVRLVKRDRNVLWVKGLDAFDGTPVVDLKPYDNWDCAADIRVPEWLKELHR